VRDPGDPAQSAAQSGLLAPIIARSPWYLQIPLDALAHFLASDGWAIASYIAFAVLAAMFPFLILVNAIAPSTIDTEANRKAMPKAKHENWVKPDDIALTIAYLCSEDCSVTSGAVIPVYGRA